MNKISQNTFLDHLISLGVPLMVIALWTHQAGMTMVNTGTVVAAALAGVLVPIFLRFMAKPLLAFVDVQEGTTLSYAYKAGGTAIIGALTISISKLFGLF